MVVYVDMIFLLNFLMDAAIVKTTAWAAKTRVPAWRIALSSLVGAAYVVMIFFPSLSFMFTFVVKFLFSLAMVAIAFGFSSLQQFVRQLGLFYAVNFTAAGAIYAAHYLLQSTREVINGVLFTHTGGYTAAPSLTAWFVLLIFFAALLFYRWTERSRERRADFVDCIAEVTVQIDEFETTCLGLIDTGNRLYDPLTRTPVMVMDIRPWEEILPASWLQILKASDTDEMMRMLIEEPESRWRDRLRMVPFQGISKDRHYMLAVKPDKVVIRHHDQLAEPEKVLVGFNGGRLSSDGSYEAIIHPDLV